MSNLRTSDTKPELALRSALHHRGLRFKVNDRQLPGKPDVVFTRARIAVQVDGCFWHGCPKHAITPKSNTEWWTSKILANQKRDRRNDEALESDGWLVIRVWEHEDPELAAERIAEAWRARVRGH